MSELPVAGDELKRLLKVAAKAPLLFAHCPGQDVEGDPFALHRTKSGEMLAKSPRSSGEGSKVAFGTAEVEGKLVSLRCDRLLPWPAKRLKKLFRANQINQNVRILDADGNVIEEAIEDLHDHDDEDLAYGAIAAADEPEAADGGQDADPPAGDAVRPSADQSGSTAQRKLLDAAAVLAKRINALGDDAARAMLVARMKDVAGAIRDAAVERAISGMEQVQQDLLLAEGNAASGARDPREVWTTVMEATDAAISALQARLGQIADPDLERIARFGLNGIIGGNQTALMKHLIEFRQSSGGARARAAAALRNQAVAYRSFLQSSELVDLCEKNPFGEAIDLRAPLSLALAEIERLAA